MARTKAYTVDTLVTAAQRAGADRKAVTELVLPGTSDARLDDGTVLASMMADGADPLDKLDPDVHTYARMLILCVARPTQRLLT